MMDILQSSYGICPNNNLSFYAIIARPRRPGRMDSTIERNNREMTPVNKDKIAKLAQMWRLFLYQNIIFGHVWPCPIA